MISVQFWTTQAYIDFTAKMFADRLKPYIGQAHTAQGEEDLKFMVAVAWADLSPQLRAGLANGTKIPVSLAVPYNGPIECHLVI